MCFSKVALIMEFNRGGARDNFNNRNVTKSTLWTYLNEDGDYERLKNFEADGVLGNGESKLTTSMYCFPDNR